MGVRCVLLNHQRVDSLMLIRLSRQKKRAFSYMDLFYYTTIYFTQVKSGNSRVLCNKTN